MKNIIRKTASSCRNIKTDGRTVIAGAVIVFLAGSLSRLLSRHPLYMLRLTGIWGHVPKIWVFVIIWTFWYLILGASFGFVLGSKSMCKEVHKYKGSLWFVIMMIFNLVWYPLFFKAGAVFLALVDIALILLFCFLTAIEYMKIYKPLGIIFLIHLLWLSWCFFMNFKAFFSI